MAMLEIITGSGSEPLLVWGVQGEGGDVIVAGSAQGLAERLEKSGVWLSAHNQAGNTAVYVPRGAAIRVTFDGSIPPAMKETAIGLDQESIDAYAAEVASRRDAE